MREIMAEDDGTVDAAPAHEAGIPLERYRTLLDPADMQSGAYEDILRYYRPLQDGRVRIIAYQAPRRLDEAPVLLPVGLVARAVAPELHKIDGQMLLSLLTRLPHPGKPPRWHVESPMRQAKREARERERLERVIPRKLINWRGGQIEIDGMAFTDCRVIRALDLAAHTRGRIPHGHQERVVSKACEGLWADGARDWLAKDITLPMIADELLRLAGPKSALTSIRRSSLEKVVGQARNEARERAGRKP